MQVEVILKKDQKTGLKTRGTVGEILTNSKYHHRGIKVKLVDGQVGRVVSLNTVPINDELSLPGTPTAKTILSDYVEQKLNLKTKDWECKKCTFLNSQFLLECEMCLSGKQDS